MKNKLIVFCYSNHSCLNYHFSGPARGFGYTVSRAILIQVYGIFWSKFGYKVFSFS